MKKKKVNKNDFLKNRILGVIILLPFIYYICNKVFELPIIYYNAMELLFCFFVTFLIIYIFINLYFKIVNGKVINKLFTFIALGLIVLYSTCTFSCYRKLNIDSLYKISEVFSTRTYENKVVVPDDSSISYSSIDVPSNIENIIIYKNADTELSSSSITVSICRKEKCQNIQKKAYIFEEDKVVVEVEDGYGIDNIIVNSTIEENWIEKVEYNNSEKFTHIKRNFTAKKILLYSFLSIIIIVIMYMLFDKIKATARIQKIQNKIGKIKDKNKNSKIKLKIEHVFVILGFIMGLFFSFAVPPYNVPDEKTHILFVYKSIGYEHIFEQINEKYFCQTCQDVIWNEDRDIDKEKFAIDNKIKLTDNSFKTPKITTKFAAYFPQVVGALIGQLFDLPIYWILMLSEFTTILFYVILGYFILKILPFKKEIMFLILFLPITIQQCSSLSYDAPLIMFSLLNFSLIMKLWYNEEDVTIKKLLPILGLTIAIILIKLPYALISLLLFIIPLKKFKFKLGKYETNLYNILKNKFVILFLILFFIMAVVFVAPKIEFGRWVITSFLEPVRILVLFARTIVTYAVALLTSMIANFGWLNTSVSPYFILLVTSFAIFISSYKSNSNEEKKYPLYAKIIMLVTFLIISGAIALAMLFAWTIPDQGYSNLNSIEELRNVLPAIDIIYGIQGRYFIPILPLLLFIPNRCNIKIKNKEYNIFTILLYLIMFVYSIYLLLFRFWF